MTVLNVVTAAFKKDSNGLMKRAPSTGFGEMFLPRCCCIDIPSVELVFISIRCVSCAMIHTRRHIPGYEVCWYWNNHPIHVSAFVYIAYTNRQLCGYFRFSLGPLYLCSQLCYATAISHNIGFQYEISNLLSCQIFICCPPYNDTYTNPQYMVCVCL